LCTFNVICKDNAAINCVTVQHKKGSFPSTLTGHTLCYFIYYRMIIPTLHYFCILSPDHLPPSNFQYHLLLGICRHVLHLYCQPLLNKLITFNFGPNYILINTD
jgi:hypothetical protein